jgi:hypothetical protein
MAMAMNLRGDLAKLSDAELAERLEEALNAVDGIRTTPGQGLIFRGCRGPLRHPIFYKLHLMLAEVPWWKAWGWIADGGTGRRHLMECELQDLHDELYRRVQSRRAAEATP